MIYLQTCTGTDRPHQAQYNYMWRTEYHFVSCCSCLSSLICILLIVPYSSLFIDTTRCTVTPLLKKVLHTSNLFLLFFVAQGCIFESNAIARYVARMRRDTELYGVSFFESAQVSLIFLPQYTLSSPTCALICIVFWITDRDQLYNHLLFVLPVGKSISSETGTSIKKNPNASRPSEL